MAIEQLRERVPVARHRGEDDIGIGITHRLPPAAEPAKGGRTGEAPPHFRRNAPPYVRPKPPIADR
jgi:hypothetical protein